MVIWAPDARKDAKEAWSHVALDNERYADKLVELFANASERLSRFPALGRKGLHPGTREFHIPRTKYFLVYRVGDAGIEIARVMHTSRQWPPKG
jgi:addiction module RelE/StbE family toxin